MSRFATLDSLKKGNGGGGPPKGDDSDDDKKGQEFFVGGGGERGAHAAVIDPKAGKGKGGSGADIVDRIMGRASEGGERSDARNNITLTFYKNGFVVADGDLRRYDDPANAAFLASVDRGEVPAELGAKARSGEIGIDVNNKKTEDYVPPAYRAFSGAGGVVGGGAPAPASAVVRGGAAGAGSSVVDESKPLATLMVKLADGRKEKVVLNLSHTVKDLQNKVASLNGTTKGFILLAGFPPKPLADGSLTLEAAGLKSAAITQKEA
jgi:UBX domain-containing protein 1